MVNTLKWFNKCSELTIKQTHTQQNKIVVIQNLQILFNIRLLHLHIMEKQTLCLL